MKRRHLLLLFLFTFSAHARATEPTHMRPPKEALDAMTAADLLKHIKVLASDEFEGRAPGSKGEELSVKYISEQFKALGLKPGNPNGSYTQEVPLAHQPSDEVNPDWDLSGAIEDLQLLFEVGYQVANGDKFPEWKPGTEFKAKRDEMMKKK